MKLEEAERLGSRIVALLEPWCEPGFCRVAGSVSRRKPEPGDIEIVCMPRVEVPVDLLGVPGEPVRAGGFATAVDSLGARVKGDAATGKYCCRETPEGVQVDIFMATPDNWGLILAIRTGPAMYARRLMCELRMHKVISVDGMLYDISDSKQLAKPIKTPDEGRVFELAGMEWVRPELRMA